MRPERVQKALDAGLYEYGHLCCPLAQKWAPYLSGAQTLERLIVAYNNSDYTFASLPIFTAGREVLLDGIRAVLGAFDIPQVVITLPETVPEATLAAVSAYDLPGLSVCTGKVNVREIGPKDLIHHPETLANIGRLERGEAPGIFVSVRCGEEEKTVVQPLETSVGGFIQAAGFPVNGETVAVVGGYFGSFLKAGQFNQPIYGYGNSRIELYPDGFCAVSYAQKASAYAAEHTCGKCTFCREGNYQLSSFLKNAVTGHGSEEDIAWLRTLSTAVAEESVCTFGQESVRFLKETLASEGKSYDAHIRGKRCDAGVCQAFTDYAVDGSLCVGCDKCRAVCPVNAIENGPGYIHSIEATDCIKCGKCAEVCPERAIYRVRVGRLIGPIKPTKVGRYRTSRKRY